jgi:auxin efflux carrier family protein
MYLYISNVIYNINMYVIECNVVSHIYTCRWNLELPSMVEGSILIMSKAGTGTAMFSMGKLATCI